MRERRYGLALFSLIGGMTALIVAFRTGDFGGLFLLFLAIVNFLLMVYSLDGRIL